MFFRKSDIKKKKPPAGMLATEVRIGDAPKPPFPMETNQKTKKSIHPVFGGRRQRRQPVNKFPMCAYVLH